METNKEKWIDEVLQSAEGIRRVSPINDLFSKIEMKLEQNSSTVISMPIIRRISSIAAMLLLLNIAGVYHYSKSSQDIDHLSNSDFYTQTDLGFDYLNYYNGKS